MPTATAQPHCIAEYSDSRGVALRVDKEASMIRGVKVLGAKSKNGRRYTESAISRAICMYEGAKVNVNHPAGSADSPRNYQDRFGVLKNVRHEQEGVYADLQFNPKHPVAEQLLWDAEHSPENVGLSHNVMARTSRKGDETVVEEIVKVQSVDLVADPATTRGLFEHEETNMEITLESVKATPAVLSALRTEFLAEQRGSDEAKARDAKLAELEAANKKLTEDLKVASDKATLAEKKAAVETQIKEAKLPEHLVTDLLREQLLAADEVTTKKIIEERQGFAKLSKPGPQSKSQHVTEGADSSLPSDAKAFAAMLKG